MFCHANVIYIVCAQSFSPGKALCSVWLLTRTSAWWKCDAFVTKFDFSSMNCWFCFSAMLICKINLYQFSFPSKLAFTSTVHIPCDNLVRSESQTGTTAGWERSQYYFGFICLIWWKLSGTLAQTGARAAGTGRRAALAWHRQASVFCFVVEHGFIETWWRDRLTFIRIL